MDRQGQGWYESKHIITFFLFKGNTGCISQAKLVILAYSIAHHTVLSLVTRREEERQKSRTLKHEWLATMRNETGGGGE